MCPQSLPGPRVPFSSPGVPPPSVAIAPLAPTSDSPALLPAGQSERELADLRLLYDALPAVHLILSREGTLLRSNPAGLRFLGYSADAVVRQPLEQFLHPEHHFSFQEALEYFWGHPAEETWELRFVNSAGQDCWLEAIAQRSPALAHLIPPGYTAALTLCGHDVTPWKQAQSILNQQNRELLALHRISTVHMGTQSAQDAFQTTVKEISDTTGFPIVAIERYDAARQVMVFEGAVGVPLPEGESLEVPIHQTLSGTVVATQQTIVKTYEPNESKLCSSNEVLSVLGIRTFVCIPMVVEQRSIGTLSLGHPELVTVDDHLLQWITSLASYLAFVTERYQANQKAVEANERFQLAAAAMQGFIYDWNLITNQVQRFEGIARLLGYAPEEMEEESTWWMSRVHPDDRPVAQQQIEEALTKSGHYTLRYRVQHRTGFYLYVWDYGVVLRDADQRPIRVVGNTIDITHHYQAEEERDRFFVLSVDMLCISGQDGYFKRLNPGWEQTLGYSTAELMAQPYLEWVHPDDQQRTIEIAQRLALGEKITAFENRYRCKDGSYRWLAWNAAPLTDRGLFYGVARDITQQKASEAALRESEERYRQLVDICPDGILIHQEGRVVFANQALLRLFGASRAEELIGREVISLVHPADQEAMRQSLAETCRQEGTPPLLEEKLVRLDGSTFDAEVVAIAYRYQGEMAVQAVIRDISDRKQAERVRRQQDERERLMNAIAHRIRQSLDLSEILNTTVDEVRQFLGCDRTIVFRLTAQGYGEVIVESVIQPWVSILGFSFFDPCFHSNFAERYCEGRVSAVADVQASGITPCYRQMLEALQIRANLIVPIVQGDRLWGLLIAHQCGGPRVWQPFEIDLLKQLATQVAIAIQQSELYQQVQTLNVTLEEQVRDRTAQLQRSIDFEALLKRITDQVRDSLDEHKILQSAVQSLAEGLGVECCDTGMYNAEQTTSTICYEYTTTLPRARGRVISIADHPEQYQQLFQGQPLQVCPIAPTPARNLARRWAILACPIADDKGVIGDLRLFRHSRDWFDQLEVRLVAQVANQCAIAIRQARLFEESQAQVRELERLNQLKDDFLSTVSHELRTPMANIKMAIQLLEILLKQQDWFNEPRNPAQRYFGILNDECDREITLINDLLDLSRLDAGTEPLMLVTIQPHLWLPSLVEPFYGRIEQQKQRVEILTPEDLPPLTTDLKHLSRVLMELISNACKYTPAHETITLAAARQGEGVEFQVSNSGVEISEAEQGRIFDKFYRIPNSDPWRHGGTGLGLALAKKLVEYLGGAIAVSSGDRRTTFTITLPLQPPPHAVEDFGRIFQAPRDSDA